MKSLRIFLCAGVLTCLAFFSEVNAQNTDPTIAMGAADVCEGTTYTYAVNPGNCQFMYWEWAGNASIPSGSSTTTRTGRIDLSWTNGGGILYAMCNCAGTDRYASLIVSSVVSLSLQVSKTSIQTGEEITLSAGGASSYSWTGPGLTANSGSTVKAKPPGGTHVYSVTGSGTKNSVSCSQTRSVTVVSACVSNFTISASSTTPTFGDVITLNTSGGTSSTWTGEGLITSSGNQVTARPPVGTTIYTVTSSNAAGTCTESKSITVVTALPPLPAATNVTLCRNSALQYDLSNQGFDLSLGKWYGPGSGSSNGPEITNSLIDLSAVADGVYKYTYVRVDNQSRSFDLTLQTSKGGTITFTQDSAPDQCAQRSGTLTSNSDRSGDILYWEKSTNNGASFLPDMSTQGRTSISVAVTSKTLYRVAAQKGSCAMDYSDAIEVKPLNPTVGKLAPSSIFIDCGHATGILSIRDNYDGDKITWQVKNADWVDIPNSNSDTYSFDVAVNAFYRARVERLNSSCAPVYSDAYEIQVVSVGGKARTNTPQACQTSTADIYLDGYLGRIVKWEYSTDNSSWTDIENSETQNPLHHVATAPDNYYRALVQLRTCTAVYSEVYKITVSDPTIGGVVRFVDESKPAEHINGELTWFPRFRLEKQRGEVQQWWKNTDILFGQPGDPINSQEDIIVQDIHKTTAFRAQVKNGGCDALYSGSATFVVNALFAGVIRVLDYTIITQYVGNSYQVANGDGLSIQDGFSFHANTAQEFFVLLDDNYSVPKPDMNFEKEETVMAENVTDDADLYFLNAAQIATSYNYLDGMGRPVQQVQRKASPEEKDLVKPFIYDGAGRPVKDLLPYASSSSDGFYRENGTSEQTTFYLTTDISKKTAASAHPFAVTQYENSPLNRVKARGAPGSEWQPGTGHAIQYDYQVNDGAIIQWMIDANGKPTRNGTYSLGDLVVSVVTNEHGYQTREFRDRKDQLVLRQVQDKAVYLETYYIYDDLGQVRYVIPPKGVESLSQENNQAFFDTWCFQYVYDDQNRVVEKKFPGNVSVWLVYDERDRVVLSQDGNQRDAHQWTFTKYDALNRPLMSGVYTHTDPDLNHHTREHVASLLSPTEMHEMPQAGGLFGYTNNVFPKESIQVNSVTHYDNYNFISEWSDATEYAYEPSVASDLPGTVPQNIAGVVTSVMSRIFGETEAFAKTVHYYDKYDRRVQTVASNLLGGYDRYSSFHDFVGRLLAQTIDHTTPGVTREILEEFNYDHNGRLLAQYHKTGTHSKVLLRQHKYNTLGQLVEKNLHLGPQGFLQSVDYRYNIRGWLSSINNAALANDNGITNDEANDWFGMEFGYQSPIGTGSLTPQYNGNIAAAKWSANLGLGTEVTQRAYHYTYDAANRMTDASLFEKSGLWRPTTAYTENVRYDRNGNIRSIQRNNKRGSLMDFLSYSYSGDKLQAVADYGIKSTGFKDGASEQVEMFYDPNGNLIKDLNRGFESVHYNPYLNILDRLDQKEGAKISYVLNADGFRLSQTVDSGSPGGGEKKSDFIGPFTYEDGKLKSIQHAEGKIVFDEDNKEEYQYQIKDHLGNVRLSFTEKEKVTELKATMEDDGTVTTSNPRVQEMAVFKNLFETEKRPVNQWLNHTSASQGIAAYLDGSSSRTIGPYTIVSVKPGDIVNMEVFGKFQNQESHESMSMATLLGILLNPATSALGAETSVVSGAATSETLTPLLSKKTTPTDRPAADLNYIFFDKELNIVAMNFDRIDPDAGFAEFKENTVDFDKLALEKVIDREGYLYVYVSNESPGSRVWFDDLTIKIRHSQVIHFEDYYPFGLSIAETAYDKANPDYNGMFTPDGSGLKDLGFRQYDPILGRFHSPDPLAELQLNLSSYAYASNNPVNTVDVLGLDPDKRKKVKAKHGYSLWKGNKQKKPGGGRSKSKTEGKKDKDKEKKKKEDTSEPEKKNPENKKGKDRKKDPGTSGKEPGAMIDDPKEPNANKENSYSAINFAGPLYPESEAGFTDKQNSILNNFTHNIRDYIGHTTASTEVSSNTGVPIEIIESNEIASRAPGAEETREYLYSHHSVNEARALEQRSVSGRTDTYESMQVNYNSTALSIGANADDFIAAHRLPIFYVLKNGGFNIEFEGATGSLYIFKINIDQPKDLKFVVKDVTVNDATANSPEIQAIFKRGAEYAEDLLKEAGGEDGFTSEKKITDFLAEHEDEIREYMENLRNAAASGDVVDLLGIPAEEKKQIQNSVDRFKDEQKLSSEVKLIDKEFFKILKDLYADGSRTTDKDVTLLMTIDPLGNVEKRIVYKNGLFVKPDQKTKVNPDKTTEVIQLEGTLLEVEKWRDHYIDKAIENEEIPVDKADDGTLVYTNQEEEPYLNIFEKAMWVIKVSKSFLEDAEIKEEHWNPTLKQNTWPFDVPPPMAGPGNAAIDELKSIPEMITFGLSMFDKEERDQVLEALQNLDWGAVKNMIKEKADRYNPAISPPEVITYEATYDGTTITIMILTGGGELIKKIIDIKNNIEILSKFEWPKIDFPYQQSQKFGADATSSPELAEAILENVDLSKQWKALDDVGVDEAVRKNPDYLKNMDEYSDRTGKTPDEISVDVKQNENGPEQFLDELEDTPASGHWDENPFRRGQLIEDDLGQNLPETFKTIDKYDNGVITSIKSLDVDAKTYQDVNKLRSRLRKYVDDLDGFTGHSQEGVHIGNVQNGLPITEKRLDLAIPKNGTPEQMAVIEEIRSYAAAPGRNITLTTIVLP